MQTGASGMAAELKADWTQLKKKEKILLNCGITVVQALSTSICLESNSHCMSHRLTDQNYCGKLTVRREEESGEKL